MKIKLLAFSLCGFFLLSSFASAQEPKTLQGYFWISGDDSEIPGTTHYNIVLEGEAARALYDIMPVSPEEDLCTGGTVKRIGSTACLLLEDGIYECDFGMDVANQEIEGGRTC